MFAPLAFVLLHVPDRRMPTASARMAFFAFAAVMGVSMASIFLVFAGASIAQMFLVAATMFAGVSLWGYTTNRDLSRWSTFLMMGLIGVVATSLINMLVGSSVIQTIVSLVGVVVFTGLTAWDTQREVGIFRVCRHRAGRKAHGDERAQPISEPRQHLPICCSFGWRTGGVIDLRLGPANAGPITCDLSCVAVRRSISRQERVPGFVFNKLS
jgi:hypothetical protein